MIDTHAHLDGDEFLEEIDEVIARAKAVGIEKILLPNVNAKTLPHLFELCTKYEGFLYPMVGLHPEDVNPKEMDVDKTLEKMEQWLQQHLDVQPRCVGVGEVGLDFYWDDTYREEQIRVFERQIHWSLHYDLPLMIHARNAHRELVDVLGKYDLSHIRGVFHCFTGTVDEASELLQFPHFLLGVGGVLTFKKSTLPAVLKEAVPLQRIVLETDAPYMAPVPHRGKRNESSFVVEVVKKLSEIYGISVADVDKQTTNNVNRIFGHLDTLPPVSKQ